MADIEWCVYTGMGRLVASIFAVGTPFTAQGVLVNPNLRVLDLFDQSTRSWHQVIIERERERS